ncbi:hypothetical protein [Gemmata sp.]|uniref:hypothetical protein n=1 Tax=Gemmata sp. TaxID=1914242 RepID=UPI003F6EF267
MPAEAKTEPRVCRWCCPRLTRTFHIFRGGKSLCGVWSLDDRGGQVLAPDLLVAPSSLNECHRCIHVFNTEIVTNSTEASK